eukprot:GHVR01005513.1.p1 GENE.GHVR01005513.1~~GHVR01005513.1.p1  ORF type:complete len:423 (+),score=104.59 GHVR01005513.1:4-1272(+)
MNRLGVISNHATSANNTDYNIYNNINNNNSNINNNGFQDCSKVRDKKDGNTKITDIIINKLKEQIEGLITTDPTELQKHSLDHSHHKPYTPDIVIYPISTTDVSKCICIAASHDISITPCGALTGLEGGGIPICGGISLDLSRMDKVVHFYKEEQQVHVQAGMRKDAFNKYVNDKGYFFLVDPASNPTLGGMAATGSSGTLCCRYGTMKENVVALRVVFADGSCVWTRRRTRKNSTGYDLTHLCMGQEGTLCVITELIVKVMSIPKGDCSTLLTFPDLIKCSNTVIALTTAELGMARCELMASKAVETVEKKYKLGLKPFPLLIVQIHSSTQEEARKAISKVREIARKNGSIYSKVASTPSEQDKLWTARRGAYFAFLAGKKHMKGTDVRLLTTDLCVPISKLAEVISGTEVDFANNSGEFG